jgi:hypothetical protein
VNNAVIIDFKASTNSGILETPYCLETYVINTDYANCPVTYSIIDSNGVDVPSGLISIVD